MRCRAQRLWSCSFVACAFLALGACEGEEPDDPVSPYPDLEISGLVVDLRGDVIDGATVTVRNAYDSATAQTGADGRYTMTIDGSESGSSVAIVHPSYRPHTSAATVDDTHLDLGSRGMMSKHEVLFTTLADGEDIYMIRADRVDDLIRLTDTPASREIAPRRSASGLVVRWVDTGANAVVEADWDGGNARTVHTVDSDYLALGIAWGERGTFVARQGVGDGPVDTLIAEDPPGATYDYAWPGQYPDESPPAFGFIGPQQIDGNMLCFVGTVANYMGGGQSQSGLFTAFPYFGNQFLVPEHIAGTAATDLYPRWSDVRGDGSLDVMFVRDYGLYVSHVTANEAQNRNDYSTPAQIYGAGADDINVQRIAWSPSISGENDRVVFAVNAFSSGSSLAGAGDLVVVEYDDTTGQIVGAPVVIYDAGADGSPGAALSVDWR